MYDLTWKIDNYLCINVIFSISGCGWTLTFDLRALSRVGSDVLSACDTPHNENIKRRTLAPDDSDKFVSERSLALSLLTLSYWQYKSPTQQNFIKNYYSNIHKIDLGIKQSAVFSSSCLYFFSLYLLLHRFAATLFTIISSLLISSSFYHLLIPSLIPSLSP